MEWKAVCSTMDLEVGAVIMMMAVTMMVAVGVSVKTVGLGDY